jgi:hypothetical protein
MLMLPPVDTQSSRVMDLSMVLESRAYCDATTGMDESIPLGSKVPVQSRATLRGETTHDLDQPRALPGRDPFVVESLEPSLHTTSAAKLRIDMADEASHSGKRARSSLPSEPSLPAVGYYGVVSLFPRALHWRPPMLSVHPPQLHKPPTLLCMTLHTDESCHRLPLPTSGCATTTIRVKGGASSRGPHIALAWS